MTPCVGHLHCCALWPTRSSPALPWLSQALPESWSDAQSPDGSSVPHFCFHSLLGPCLLNGPLTTAAFWSGCRGAPACPQPLISFPGGTWWVGWVSGSPSTPICRPPRLLAGILMGLPSGSGYQGVPTALPGRGSPHSQQGKAMRSPHVTGPTALNG